MKWLRIRNHSDRRGTIHTESGPKAGSKDNPGLSLSDAIKGHVQSAKMATIKGLGDI